MRTAIEETDRAIAFCQQLEDLVVERGSDWAGPESGQTAAGILVGRIRSR